MAKEITKTTDGHVSPFERIKRTNDAGMEFWSSRDFSEVLGYGDYRNFEGVIEKAKMACFNSGHRLEDHFVDITEMVAIGSGAERPVNVPSGLAPRRTACSQAAFRFAACDLTALIMLPMWVPIGNKPENASCPRFK